MLGFGSSSTRGKEMSTYIHNNIHDRYKIKIMGSIRCGLIYNKIKKRGCAWISVIHP